MLTADLDTTRAVFYRHWLEHAGAAVVALGFAALLCAGYAVAMYAGRDPFTAHIIVAATAAWLLPLFLHGTGIRTNDLQPGHRSLHYTLTLPVPRSLLVWTRFAVAAVSATVLQMLLLWINTATATLLGGAAPLAAMAAASALATLLLLTVVAAINLMNIWDDRMWFLAFPFAFAVTTLAGWQRAVGLVGGATAPWTTAAIMGLAIGASLALTTWIAHRRDF
jgi:hypothetical protein